MLSEVRWSVSSKTEPELISPPVKSPLSQSALPRAHSHALCFAFSDTIRLDIPVSGTHSGRYFELQNEKLLMFAAGETVSLDWKWYLKIKQTNKKRTHCNICNTLLPVSQQSGWSWLIFESVYNYRVNNGCPQQLPAPLVFGTASNKRLIKSCWCTGKNNEGRDQPTLLLL